MVVDPEHAVGPALVAASAAGATSIDLLVDGDASAAVAATAAQFDPAPSVWRIDDTSLSPAEPQQPASAKPAPEIEPVIAKLIDRPDVDHVIEQGELIVECRGLEVARVRGLGAEQRVDIGVGAYDQGAFAVMHPELTDAESLDEVVRQVMQNRSSEAPPHPLNRLVRERWLRYELVADPSKIELTDLRNIEGRRPRTGLHDAAPAFAVGLDAAGRTVLVACSVGIDPTLVPHAAAVAGRENAGRIVLVLPARDQHRITIELAERLRLPCVITTADEPWPS